MKRGGPLKRKTRLRRKTGVRQRNPERLAKRRAIEFGPQAERCRYLRCCACGSKGQSDPAHLRSRGAGGRDRGNVVPLCRPCHDAQHTEGIRTFQRRRGLDLVAVAWAIAAQLEAEGVEW